MLHIRPKDLFQRLEGSPVERIAKVPIPNRKGLGGLMLLETFLLLACVRIVKARRFFEIGTFLGSTALSLAMNSPEDSEVFTLDLDSASAELISQPEDEVPITQLRMERLNKLDFAGMPEERRIKTLFGDSTHFDFSPWHASIDLVFIDGGHTYPVVKSDTENAFRMLNPEKPACILWHDYGNPDCDGLKRYLDDLSANIEIAHVEDTWLCVHFNAKAK